LTITVNLRRLERLETKTGVGKSWVESLSNAELNGLILAIETGEIWEDISDEAKEAGYDLEKDLKDMAVRYSNYPDGSYGMSSINDVLDELQALGAPKAAAMFVEAVKAERLSAPYLWPDWRKALSRRVLEMLEET
jgi:hypothetical protein